jgi:hypothetical protein|tara:strand:+ start:10508 stop:10768 length:261 start_codon:yes stop_codon:yes gene_type:complete
MRPTLEKWNNFTLSNVMIETCTLEMFEHVTTYLDRQGAEGAYEEMMSSVNMSFSTVHPALRDVVFASFAITLMYDYPNFDFNLFTQ